MIKLQSLILKNFKGIKNFECEFGNEITTIEGDNGTGKSTIFDGFAWLMFGKNSNDKKDFEIQTLDSNNNVIHHLEHEVIGVLDIDGVKKTLKRTLKEKWQKTRGAAEQELKGTTTTYEVDGIPVKLKEYQEVINNMIDENIFKMVTNPMYFSGLNWSKQREILLEIIGDISEENVINYNDELKPLSELLTDGIDNFNKRTKASIVKLKDQVKSIPYRIDECNNSIVEADFGALELKKANIQSEINAIDEQIADVSKANEGKLKLQDMLYKKKEEKSKRMNDALKNANKPLENINEEIINTSKELHDIESEIFALEMDKKRNMQAIKAAEENYNNNSVKRKELLTKYHEEDDKVFEFDTSLSCCPTCGREYDQNKIDEIKTKAEDKFNENKKNTVDSIISGGKKIADSMKVTEQTIDELTEKNIVLDSSIEEKTKKKEEIEYELNSLKAKKSELDITKELHFDGEEELKAKIDELENQIEQFQEEDNSVLKARKRELQEELEYVTKTLGKKDTNAELNKRMEELNQEEKDLQIKIAELEGQQYLGEQFIRTKVELLEDSINKKFKDAVTFKLFNQQVNGGLNETCEALINGVPFSDANTASKINAGLSIINTLCEHYNISAPIFVDNAEAVNELQHTDSQLIKLVVSLDKELKVEVDK